MRASLPNYRIHWIECLLDANSKSPMHHEEFECAWFIQVIHQTDESSEFVAFSRFFGTHERISWKYICVLSLPAILFGPRFFLELISGIAFARHSHECVLDVYINFANGFFFSTSLFAVDILFHSSCAIVSSLFLAPKTLFMVPLRRQWQKNGPQSICPSSSLDTKKTVNNYH